MQSLGGYRLLNFVKYKMVLNAEVWYLYVCQSMHYLFPEMTGEQATAPLPLDLTLEIVRLHM